MATQEPDSVTTENGPYWHKGRRLAIEHKGNHDALYPETIHVVLTGLAAQAREIDRLTAERDRLTEQVSTTQAKRDVANARLIADDYVPDYDRRAKAKLLEAMADDIAKGIKRLRPIHLAMLLLLLYLPLVYTSLADTAFVGHRIDETSTRSKLAAALGTIIDPEAIPRAWRERNLVVLGFPVIPIAIALTIEWARRRRWLLAALVAAAVFIDLFLASSVARSVHNLSIRSGLVPPSTLTVTDLLIDGAFWLSLVLGLGAAALLGALNFLRRDQIQEEEKHVAELRKQAQAHLDERERDIRDRVSLGEDIANLSTKLEITKLQLDAARQRDHRKIAADLNDVKRGWLHFVSELFSTNKDALKQARQHAERAVAAALKRLANAIR